MATLILTAVGQAFGGPIGGAIGSILGQAIDQRIFAPKARHGPRLGDLAVQTSSYGSFIPKLFGTMRVAGTVIWSTDLVESRSTGGGGKGRPKTVNYSYSASFAVALSARPILGVGRIWADGKLLRGEAGDFKSATGFRLHPGDEDQQADPLIAAAEAAAPAYRGIAYAVFEDFQLEDYGNRIPSLTFEAAADAGAVTIGAIAEALSGGAVAAGATPALAGYAAAGDSVRGAIEALADVVPLSLADGDGRLLLTAEGGEPVALGADEEQGRREIVRRGLGQIPAEVSIAYHEPERDYQAGLQRAVRGDGLSARNADRRALPAALSAGAAKALAEFRLAMLSTGRVTATVRLGWRRAALRPGGRVQLAGESGLWRVTRWTLGPMQVTLDLVRAGAGPLPDPAATPGRPVSQPDLPHGPTILHLLDLPLADSPGAGPLLFAAAAGAQAGWRRAALMTSFDGGASWQAAGGTAAPAVLGTALDALPGAGSALFDDRASLEIELASDAMWLESRDDDALAGGANLAAVGGELIQFGAAQPVGDRRFRLSRLLRGRRGTEWAAGGHAAGEGFTLIDAGALVTLPAPAGSIGGEARVLATGISDDSETPAVVVAIEGASLRPPSPVHVRAIEAAAGAIAISWVRRSRQGWSWPNGSDAPLGEESERYRLAISGAGFERFADCDGPSFLYTAALQAEDGAARPLTVSISQIGTFAASRPAALILD